MDGQIDIESLGERMVRAARMAVAIHLQHASGGNSQQQEYALGQRVEIGGAGPRWLSSLDDSSVPSIE